ncbi:hypothetical protein EBR57_07690 [bacterium]|nr:hypothetical protein [bacterium]
MGSSGRSTPAASDSDPIPLPTLPESSDEPMTLEMLHAAVLEFGAQKLGTSPRTNNDQACWKSVGSELATAFDDLKADQITKGLEAQFEVSNRSTQELNWVKAGLRETLALLTRGLILPDGDPVLDDLKKLAGPPAVVSEKTPGSESWGSDFREIKQRIITSLGCDDDDLPDIMLNRLADSISRGVCISHWHRIKCLSPAFLQWYPSFVKQYPR